jgi:uncharacterized coiled-coil protein SlyX
MAYSTGTGELLATIGERLSAVVDPALRARLSGVYLGLLQQQSRGGTGPEFNAGVAALWEQVKGGLTQYSLWPGLGTVHGKFYDALDSAEAVMERLDKLVEMQGEAARRTRWRAELEDARFMLEKLSTEADMASTNAHLSRLDALAVSVANITSVQLIPRLAAWSKELRRNVPQVVPTGDFGITAFNASPEMFLRPEGLGDAVGAFTDLLTRQLTGQGAAEGAALLAEYKRDVLLAKGLRGRHALQEQQIGRLAEANPLKAEMNRQLAERAQRLDSVVATLRALANNLKTMSFDAWDEPYAAVREALGELSPDHSAALAFYAPDLKKSTAELAALQAGADAADRQLGTYKAGSAAGAFALGIGVLALLAMFSGKKGR